MASPRAIVRRLRSRARQVPYLLGYRYGPLVMSALRKRWVLASNPHANIRFGAGVYLGPGFSLWIPNGGTFIAGPGVEFRRDFRAEVDGTGSITIGADSVCTYYVLMQCTTSIDIGERCAFGQSVLVLDGQHRFRDTDEPMLDQGYDFEPIRIEQDATLLSKSTVMASVGRRAVVGANAVVTRPIPAYTVAVGVPARPIDYFGPTGGVPPM